MNTADRLRNDPDALLRLIEEHRILKETVENSPVLFCVYDADDRLLAWNRAYEANHPEAFAASRQDESLGQMTYADLVRHEISRKLPAAQIEDEVARRVEMQKTANGMPVVRHYDSSGWTQVYKYRLPSGAIAGLAVDVNALKQREAELIEARRIAETAERVKGSFLARMSHEIRTPMNGIIGMAECLFDSDLTPDQRLSLDTILSSGEALLNLINDILDFSKIEAGKMELVLRPFSLLDEAEALCRLLMPRARALGLDLILDVDPALDVALVGDSARLRQIMTNLLGNALKFTPTGHILLRIESRESRSSTHRDITISVQDTGIGIPAERQKAVFHAFEQVHQPGANQIGGTGLGLSITADLISAMNGVLDLSSVEGRGSTFQCSLTLPLARRVQDKIPRAPVPYAAPGSRGTIHLIDPSPLHAAPILRNLRHLGFVPQRWETLTDHSLTDAPKPLPGPLVLSDRAIPEHDVTAHLGHIAGAGDPVIVLWNRRGAPPRPANAQVLLEPVSLVQWFDLLNDGPQRIAPAPAAPTARQLDLYVLVAEDNRTNRLVLERMLKGRVTRLEFAENGRLALERAIAHRPDVILMDMAMPVMGGLDATRAIRAHEARAGAPRCTILALTANAMSSDRDACLDAGMDDFLTKPVRLEQLLQNLANIRPLETPAPGDQAAHDTVRLPRPVNGAASC